MSMQMRKRAHESYNIQELLADRLAAALIIAPDRPGTLLELRIKVATSCGRERLAKLTSQIQELVRAGIMKCLTPELRCGAPGRVYGLSPEKGRRIRKLLCGDRGTAATYSEPQVDWQDYGWAACGRQKKAIMGVMSDEPLRPKDLLKKLKAQYRPRTQSQLGEPRGISRQNLNDILQQAVRRGIVIKEEEHRRKRVRQITRYRLSESGRKIKQLLIETP